jgi:hypothetical protein
VLFVIEGEFGAVGREISDERRGCHEVSRR